MVLVLFLMAMIASAALFLTENVEDQAKYDNTKARMEAIRLAIIGDTTRTLNGETELRGFVMDMGRLPECLRELIDPIDCDGVDYPNNQLWRYNDARGIAYGWNGPYLQASSETDGVSHFRDGYRNQIQAGIDEDGNGYDDDDQNSGWKSFEVDGGQLAIVSEGFDADPATDDDVTENTLIRQSDYVSVLANEWQSIQIDFRHPTDDDFTLAQDELRVRLNYPTDGEVLDFTDATLDTLAERDLTQGLSDTFPSFDFNYVEATPAYTFDVNDDDTLTFLPDVTLNGSNNIEITANTTLIYTDDSSGQSLSFKIDSSCGTACITNIIPTTNIDESAGLLNQVTFNSSLTLSIPADFVDGFPIFTVQNLVKPYILLPAGSSILGTTITLPLGATITVPAGSADTIINNYFVLGDGDITVSEAFLQIGNIVTTGTSGDTFVVPDGTVQSGNDLTILARLPLVLGQRSLTIVCESIDGAVFTGFDDTTGDCESVDDDSTPHTVTFAPRTVTPLPPNPLVWTIQ
jgi:hypothetical protein